MLIPIATLTLAQLPRSGNRSFGYARATHIHNGIDLPAPKGTPVVSAAPGVVTHASAVWQQGFTGYGRHVVVAHPDRTYALYAHLDSVAVVPGQTVDEGAELGTVGNSLFQREHGYTNESGGAHLHFEVSPAAYPLPSSAGRLDPVAWLHSGARDVLAQSSAPSSAAGAGGALVLIAAAAGVAWLYRKRA